MNKAFQRPRLASTVVAALGSFLIASAQGQWANTYEDYNFNGDISTGGGFGLGSGNGHREWNVQTTSCGSSVSSSSLYTSLAFKGWSFVFNDSGVGSASQGNGNDSLAWGGWDWTGPQYDVTTATAYTSMYFSGNVYVNGRQNGTSGSGVNHVYAAAACAGDTYFYSGEYHQSGGVSGWAHGQAGGYGTSYGAIAGSSGFSATSGQSVSYSNNGTASSFTATTNFTLSYSNSYDSDYGSTQFFSQVHSQLGVSASVSSNGSGNAYSEGYASADMSGSTSISFSF